MNFFFIYSLELRELQAKLRAGYMNRERAAQLAEKTARDCKEKVWLYSVKLAYFHMSFCRPLNVEN